MDDGEASSDDEVVRQPKRPATTALQDLFDDEDAPATKLVSRKKSDKMEVDEEEDEEEGQIVAGKARDRSSDADEESDDEDRRVLFDLQQQRLGR